MHPKASRIDLVLTWLLSLAFLAAAGAKLAGDRAAVEAFERFGLPHVMVWVTAGVELIGALALHWRVGLWGLSGPAMLASTMAVAVGLHLAHDPPALAMPAAVLLVMSASLVGWRGRRLMRGGAA
ncbi:MAG: DoxX family protein [Lysobacterales bacterium]